jgi:hypothetical protein
MKAPKLGVLKLFVGFLCATASAQTGGFALAGNIRQLHVPPQAQHVRSSMYRYLASDEGRAWMQVSGNPKSKYLNHRFGAPSAAAVERARIFLLQMAAQPQQLESESSAGPVPCTGKSGARFNLEPRANALPQYEATADFILNGAGSGADLIVQAANDARGNLTGGRWDGSVSGYYVHTSGTADCSVQFEGGLPNFGNNLEVGQEVVAADSVRGNFFVAGDLLNNGAALFRAAASDLLNPAKCPNGTHNQKQAETCWMQTPPAIVDAGDESFPELGLAVDGRGTGTGAGDVYVAGGGTLAVFIVACTNSSLTCSPMVPIDQNDNFNAPFVQVRPDGVITISYMEQGSGLSDLVKFVTCTPAGAPKAPVCGKPATVTTVANALGFEGGIRFVAPNGFSYTQHANRQESDGSFTTFLVYDECSNAYMLPPPQQNATFCLSSSVDLTFSTDNGQTWSQPVSTDKRSGFHVFPTITNDASTGTVSIVHYSTEGDYFEHEIRVILNQIPLGSTAFGPPQPVTSFTPTDDPPALGFQVIAGFELYMGAVAHGTGTTGQSHLYLSFDSEAVNGTYDGKPLPELNNHIKLLTF